MRRLRLLLLAFFVSAGALPTAAQVQAVSTFGEYSSPFTTEFQATIGRPVQSGVLDFYASEFFVPGGTARNVLGTWGTSPSDPGSVNRPTNISTSTAMFGTRPNEEIDVFGAGS